MFQRGWTRREFVGALGVALTTGSLRADGRHAPDLPPVPKVNGGINVQPLRRFGNDPPGAPPLIVPELIDLQLRVTYELGFGHHGFGAGPVQPPARLAQRAFPGRPRSRQEGPLVDRRRLARLPGRRRRVGRAPGPRRARPTLKAAPTSGATRRSA